MSEWAFRDYVDRRGTNQVLVWLYAIPAGARAKVDVRLLHLSTGVLPFSFPNTRKLKKKPCIGLFEVRVEYGNVQYRPLGYLGPGQGTATLLMGATEKNDTFVPPNACITAKNRMAEVESDKEKFSCEHSFGST